MRGMRIFGASLLALAVAACNSSEQAEAEEQPESPEGANTVEAEAPPASNPEAEAKAAADFEKLATENAAASAAFLEENAAREGVATADDGLQYMVLEEGAAEGVKPALGDLIDIEYVGTSRDGVEFDSSGGRGAAARFPLTDQLPGWTKGIMMMREGDRYRFFAPSELAYGKDGAPPVIGPNEAVIYEVELLKVHSAEKNLEAANKFLEENGKKEGVTTTESGLQYEVLTEGPADGENPTAADVVRVHYQGTLINGTEFDSSYSRGQPAEFPLGQVIAGWTEGVQLMKVGDKFRFFVPPDLGYKETGTPGGPIGPNEALIFEVELLEIK